MAGLRWSQIGLIPAAVWRFRKNGEFEGGDFWEEHEDLLRSAWRERVPLHAELYEYGPAFEREYLHPQLRDAVQKARLGQEKDAHELFEEIIPGWAEGGQHFVYERGGTPPL